MLRKAEVTRLDNRAPRDNARHVVTNLDLRPGEIDTVDDLGRGESDNRSEELAPLGLDRVSGSDLLGNPFRVLVALAALVSMQEICTGAAARPARRIEVGAIRAPFLELAAPVTATVRRIVPSLPLDCPFRNERCLTPRSLATTCCPPKSAIVQSLTYADRCGGPWPNQAQRACAGRRKACDVKSSAPPAAQPVPRHRQGLDIAPDGARPHLMNAPG